jgi:hypothetical protein
MITSCYLKKQASNQPSEVTNPYLSHTEAKLIYIFFWLDTEDSLQNWSLNLHWKDLDTEATEFCASQKRIITNSSLKKP